jgi:hypothetical protein
MKKFILVFGFTMAAIVMAIVMAFDLSINYSAEVAGTSGVQKPPMLIAGTSGVQNPPTV